jgi:hypothetical protein
LIEGLEIFGDSSSLEVEDTGLPVFLRERLDIRLSHDDPVPFSFRSVEDSRSDVHGLNRECLLTELSRESVFVSIVDGVTARMFFLRNIDVDNRRSVLSVMIGVEEIG